MLYTCWDESGTRVEFEAETPEAAAEKYVEGGSRGDDNSTCWIHMHVADNEGDMVWQGHIAVEPTEPKCASQNGHDWQSPHEAVGGIAENPGVHGHGGGVSITEVCSHCGWHRVTDTWAQCGDCGKQGLESTSYSEPDEPSLAWVARLQEESRQRNLDTAEERLEQIDVHESHVDGLIDASEGPEHWRWLAEAPEDEIVTWLDSMEPGAPGWWKHAMEEVA